MGRVSFGTMPDGTPVDLYTLTDGTAECEIITYGGAVRSLRVPDRDGKMTDVFLGFDTLEDYVSQDKYIAALVGRYANRIGGAAFDLNGARYPLAANNGRNHLHGGIVGFNSRVWTVTGSTENSVTLTLESQDMEEGYPGNLSVEVTYSLRGGALTIDYRAKSDKDTLCNLTNHAYINLSGHDSGPIVDQEVRLFADFYTPTDAESIPTGEIAPVDGTPMDLREWKRIGEEIDSDFQQLVWVGGYDHNWVVNGPQGTLRPAARARSRKTGIEMEVRTTLPGVQFYTGNSMAGCPAGKGGAPYGNRWGFCLETQLFPDSPHHPNFPTSVLKAGEEWHHTTAFAFSLCD